MNQHVDRRAVLASSAAATAVLAGVAVSSRRALAEGASGVAGEDKHPDAELFRLEKEMDEASERVKKLERSQNRKSKSAAKAAGPRPLHPHDWKEPAMPRDLWEMNRSALDRSTFAEVRDGTDWIPAPVAAWQREVARQRELVKAEWNAYGERHAEQLRLAGYDGGEPAFKEACDEEWQIGMQILTVVANTLEGIMVKVKVGDRLGLGDFAENDAYNSIVADLRRLARAEAPPEPRTAASVIPRDELLAAYSEWLHFERLNLMREIWPDQNPHEMVCYVPANTLAGTFHFPTPDSGLTWETMPQPGSRAAAVMKTAGVDLAGRWQVWNS
ncbi:hypothetical protein [Mesorhizobium sp. RIZ17]|uniref:hypothetical protein n=1 Tax=Mesorhizobium sp. RIZ17 TaxID=3132743 RepID=UPI003DA7DF5E